MNISGRTLGRISGALVIFLILMIATQRMGCKKEQEKKKASAPTTEMTHPSPPPKTEEKDSTRGKLNQLVETMKERLRKLEEPTRPPTPNPPSSNSAVPTPDPIPTISLEQRLENGRRVHELDEEIIRLRDDIWKQNGVIREARGKLASMPSHYLGAKWAREEMAQANIKIRFNEEQIKELEKMKKMLTP